jgi:uncharacterized protein GlcG (DUF336 family)
MSRHGKDADRCDLSVRRLEDRTAPALIASQLALAPPVIENTTSGGMPRLGGEVKQLLDRASHATASNDAIIAIVDRGGTILGVLTEAGVAPQITGNQEKLGFAIDGAVALARTAAFFANDTAPLTSRTINDLSQTTITQREVESDPNINDPNSTLRGPGFVAPIGVKGHFPPGVAFAPQVDLFAIEHTNRDSFLNPGADGIKGTADDVPLATRFNAPFDSGQAINPPLSYGESILTPAAQMDPAVNHFQSRGIGTLPGGIPLYKDGVLVGGIGVFFPGTTGFATEENSSLGSGFDPTKPDRSLEAEFIGLAAEGGSSALGLRVGPLGGVDPVPGYDLPDGRIDLAGITLNVVGPGGDQGPTNLVEYAFAHLGVGQGSGAGTFQPVNSAGAPFLRGRSVPEGYLVSPRAGGGLTAADVRRIIEQGIAEAFTERAQIRLPSDERTRMVLAVTDGTGSILGLYRMPDATVFSIDVAVAKARNDAYYNNAAQLQPQDQVAGLPPGAAITNRTVRYLAHPQFPVSVDGTAPGPFSILNDPGTNPRTALDSGPPLPASVFQTVQGYDAFHPGTNFHDPFNLANQNGIVFFPGSSGVYKGGALVGGFGVSGDGVNQDDVVTSAGIGGFEAPPLIRADQFFVRGVRLPYFNFPRNPEA